jgi:hypothetical protein
MRLYVPTLTPHSCLAFVDEGIEPMLAQNKTIEIDTA